MLSEKKIQCDIETGSKSFSKNIKRQAVAGLKICSDLIVEKELKNRRLL